MSSKNVPPCVHTTCTGSECTVTNSGSESLISWREISALSIDRAEALDAENKQLKEDITQLRDERAGLRLNLLSARERVSQVEAENERLQRENGSLARAYAACERLLRGSTEENDRLHRQIDYGQQEIIQHKSENEESDSRIITLEWQLSEATRAATDARAELERLRAALRQILTDPDAKILDSHRDDGWAAMGPSADYGDTGQLE